MHVVFVVVQWFSLQAMIVCEERGLALRSGKVCR